MCWCWFVIVFIPSFTYFALAQTQTPTRTQTHWHACIHTNTPSSRAWTLVVLTHSLKWLHFIQRFVLSLGLYFAFFFVVVISLPLVFFFLKYVTLHSVIWPLFMRILLLWRCSYLLVGEMWFLFCVFSHVRSLSSSAWTFGLFFFKKNTFFRCYFVCVLIISFGYFFAFEI